MAKDPNPAGDLHGPDHRGCSICDPSGGQPTPSGRSRPAVVRLRARGEDFKIVQLHGNLFVCSRANGNCCCGWEEKGRMPFDNALWNDEWERRRVRSKLHLTFSGCLGPCAVGNNALLQLFGRSIWFKDLNDAALPSQVFDYIEAMLAAGVLLPVPAALSGHVYERYLTPNGAASELAIGGVETAPTDFEGLDPVCLMDVDLLTTKHKVEYANRTFGFCAASCKKRFLDDPAAYCSVVAES